MLKKPCASNLLDEKRLQERQKIWYNIARKHKKRGGKLAK